MIVSDIKIRVFDRVNKRVLEFKRPYRNEEYDLLVFSGDKLNVPYQSGTWEELYFDEDLNEKAITQENQEE